MTIEQKLEQFRVEQNDSRPLESKVGEVEFLLDEYKKLDDDFESRACENCKYFKESNFPIGRCISEISLLSTELTLTSFGCNKFERKQND